MTGRPGASLVTRLRATLLALGLVLLVVVGLALAALLQVRADQQRITGDYFTVVQDSNAGFVTVLEVDDAAEDYLETGDPADLAALNASLQPRPDAVDGDELEARLREAPAALAALTAVGQQAQAWIAEQSALVQAVEQGGPDAVTDAQRRDLEDSFAAVRTGYDAYIDEVVAARDDLVDELDERTSLLFAAVVAAVATAVVAGVVLYSALQRWVTRPLLALGAETQTVCAGDLEHRVRVDGPPEITSLGTDIEAMRRGLVEQLAEVERAQALLEQQAEDLRRSNRDLEQFAYVASHDLQEPLRKVSSFTQMLERRYKGQLDERADQYIAFAVDGAKRMQLLINDLLAFSRVGRMDGDVTDVAMDDVLAEVLATLSDPLESAGATVTSDPLPVLPGERRLLVQLLQNLVGNAVKFHGDAPPRVHVSAREREDGFWQLSVADNGIGIDPQYAERIFVIFQRLHAKSEYEGTGIGLALCKKIVEHHGGSIWLEPSQGTGTTFSWTLPVQAPVRLEPDVVDDAATPREADDAPTGAEQEKAWTATSR